MSYKVILFDFDDTLVDFHDAEVKAYAHLMSTYRVPKAMQDYEGFKKSTKPIGKLFNAAS